MKSSSPASRTNPTGSIALSCQLTCTELNPKSSTCERSAGIVRGLLPGASERWRAAAPGWIVSAGAPIASASDCVRLSIGVQSGQQVGHTEKCEHHYGKAQDGEVCGTAPTPSASYAHVQISR